MYDPAVLGNKSPFMKDEHFIPAPLPKMLPLAFCCVLINDCKIYAKRIRWYQVFLARSWESCQTLLFLINGKRAASWLHLTWRVLLTPCQVEFNNLIFVFFYAIRTVLFVLLTHIGPTITQFNGYYSKQFSLVFKMGKVIIPISVCSIIFKGQRNGLFFHLSKHKRITFEVTTYCQPLYAFLFLTFLPKLQRIQFILGEL